MRFLLILLITVNCYAGEIFDNIDTDITEFDESNKVTMVENFRRIRESLRNIHHAIEWVYNSGWFTANTATLYTKAHSISFDFPTEILDIQIFWRTNASSSYIIPIDYDSDTGSGNGSGCSYDGTNIYVKCQNRWGRYTDSGGTFQDAGNGELLILARISNNY